jgi:N-methylhydantoinase B/oxoprolinase/acetone carboxylase alpha subunit
MVDPITVEVVRAAMNAAAEEMKICMLKTTYSLILNEARDFGCAIFDAGVNMVAEAVGLPLFQGHLGWPVLATIRDRGWDDIHPGDIFIHNDPYDGGGNLLNDVVMYAPFFADGKPLGFVVTKAHWVDVGGSVPGSMAVDTTEFYQEGLRLQSLKLFQRGEENRDVTAPWGLADGKSGMTNQVLITEPEGKTRSVRKGTRVPIRAGSLVSIHTGGGGGYGDPLARPVERVQADVIDGYCSLESAREQYGVVLHPETLEVDEGQTAELRRTRRAA